MAFTYRAHKENHDKATALSQVEVSDPKAYRSESNPA